LLCFIKQATCNLPLQFGTEDVITGCVELDGQPACWNDAVGWISCPRSLLINGSMPGTLPYPLIDATIRATVDNYTCLLPIVIQVLSRAPWV
jgi:hypothetical protein